MTTAETASSDLSTRFAAGVVMIAVACAAIWYGGWPFRILVSAVAVVMMIEWGDMHRVSRTLSYAAGALLVVLLLGVAQWLYPVDEIDYAITAGSFGPAWTGFALALAMAVLAGLASRRFAMGGGFLYVAIPSFALLVLDWLTFELVFWAMAVTWATDIFAYFAGRSIGGPKLAPRISPKKTWAGLGGGVIGAAAFGAIVARLFDLDAPFPYVGGLMAIVAQVGDLYESWLKRRAGIKDSGSILPGHGGVLDRVDGLLPVVVATFLLLWGLSAS